MKYEIETKKIENFILNRVSMAVLSGVKGAVLGISGGIDSALVATLCVRALGKQNVHGLLLPFGFDRMEDAVLMVGQLGIKNTTIDIEPICRSIGLTGNKTVDGNIKARARMICLYKYANEHNLMVVGTGNRSEEMMGYFTKYGDGGVDINPIAHLYKTEVREMSKHLGVPDKIIKKPPSANLWEGQTDEGEMGITYKRLDRILEYLDTTWEAIEMGADSIDDIIEGDRVGDRNMDRIALDTNTSKKEVELVIKKIIQTKHKRELPPMLKRE